jgi:hypothetical protein
MKTEQPPAEHLLIGDSGLDAWMLSRIVEDLLLAHLLHRCFCSDVFECTRCYKLRPIAQHMPQLLERATARWEKITNG